MTEQTNDIRSDLIDTAISFLKNPKVVVEPMEKKREFLQKKGLNDYEIDYAFKIVPQKEIKTQIVSKQEKSSFFRRIITDLILAGLIGFALKLIKRWFNSKNSIKPNELNETIKTLQKTIADMQKSLNKLEQATDQLHLTVHSTTTNVSTLEEIKREIQSLKGLCLNRSQFPSIPQIPLKLPSWQLEAAEKFKSRSTTAAINLETNSKTINDENKEDGDSIIVVSENEKKSDDEHRLSISPSSESSNDT